MFILVKWLTLAFGRNNTFAGAVSAAWCKWWLYVREGWLKCIAIAHINFQWIILPKWPHLQKNKNKIRPPMNQGVPHGLGETSLWPSCLMFAGSKYLWRKPNQNNPRWIPGPSTCPSPSDILIGCWQPSLATPPCLCNWRYWMKKIWWSDIKRVKERLNKVGNMKVHET